VSVAAATRIELRTGWKAPVVWLVALGATFVLTVAAIDSLYSTAADYQSYADTVAAAPAMDAINGTPYGADTLGGIVSNEFGFFTAIAVPLMGLMLVSGRTRKAEEAGLMELLLSRSIGRRDPWIAAALIAVVTELLLGALIMTSEIAYGVPPGGAALYATSVVGLGAVFSGLAVFVGQLVRRGAGVTGVGVLVLGVVFVARAIGAVHDNGWRWASPLAWQQETRPFTDAPRLWPLLLLFGTAAAFTSAGLYLVARRDLGAAVVASRHGRPTAGVLLRSRAGLAAHLHGYIATAWILGTLATAAVFGVFTGDIADIVDQMPQMGDVFGTSGSVEAGYVGMMIQLVGLMAVGAGAASVTRLRSEETADRLEPTLVAVTGRAGWIGPQFLTALAVAAATHLAGGLGLWITARSNVGGIWTGVFAQLPAVLLLVAIGLLLVGAVPRLTPLLWAPLAYVALVAMLGTTIRMPEWSMKLSPMYLIGLVPADDVAMGVVAGLVAGTVALVVAAAAGMRHRDVPI